MPWQTRFDPAKIEELKFAFSLFDKDNDGTISVKELGSVLKSMGHLPSDEELKRMIRAADTDGSGVVEFNEFLEMMAENMEATDEEIKTAFQLFDRDRSGTITHAELRMVCKNLNLSVTEDDIADMIRVADKDNDGTVDYKEFILLMKQ